MSTIVAKGRKAESFHVDVSNFGAVEEAVGDVVKKMGQ